MVVLFLSQRSCDAHNCSNKPQVENPLLRPQLHNSKVWTNSTTLPSPQTCIPVLVIALALMFIRPHRKQVQREESYQNIHTLFSVSFAAWKSSSADICQHCHKRRNASKKKMTRDLFRLLWKQTILKFGVYHR